MKYIKCNFCSFSQSEISRYSLFSIGLWTAHICCGITLVCLLWDTEILSYETSSVTYVCPVRDTRPSSKAVSWGLAVIATATSAASDRRKSCRYIFAIIWEVVHRERSIVKPVDGRCFSAPVSDPARSRFSHKRLSSPAAILRRSSVCLRHIWRREKNVKRLP